MLWEVNKGSGLRFTLSPQERLQSRPGPEAGDQGQAATSPGRPRALPRKPSEPPRTLNHVWGLHPRPCSLQGARLGPGLVVSVRGSLLCTPDPVGTCAGPPARPMLATAGVFRQRAPTQGETRRGHDLPAPSPGVQAAMGTPGALGLPPAVGGGTGREGDLKTHTATAVTLGAHTSILGDHLPVATPQAWHAAGMAWPGAPLPWRVGGCSSGRPCPLSSPV